MANDDDADFDALLSVTMDNIPDEVVLPSGDWLLKGDHIGFYRRETGAPQYVFYFEAIEPMADVDEEELNELPDGYAFNNTPLNFTVYVEKPTDWKKAVKVLTAAGIQLEGSFVTSDYKVPTALNRAFKGSRVIATLGNRSFENREGEIETRNTVSKIRSMDTEE